MRNSTSKTIGLATLALAMSANAAAQLSWDKDNKVPLFGTHRTIATFADFDNNGKMDIYYGGQYAEILDHRPGAWCWEPLSNLFLQQADGSFIGDTANSECDREPGTEGEEDQGHWNFISWKNGIYGNAHAIYATLDYNNDGLVDLIVNGTPQGDYYHFQNPGRPFMWLYKNNGDGTFTKVEEAVFPNIYAERDGDNWNWYHQNIAVGDYDHDGYTDILVTGDLFDDEGDGAKPSFCAVKLYRNVNGTGQFAEQLIAKTKVAPTTNPVKDEDGNVIEEGKPLAEGSFMPMRGNAAFVDLNNDGWLDIVTEGTSQNGHGSNICFIYINEQGKSFKEVTPDTDTYPFYTLRHSAMNFADFDKDGYLDFFLTGWGDNGYNWNAFLYTNAPDAAEDGFFLEAPAQCSELGLDGTEGRRQVVADLDGDGYLDIHYGADQTWPYMGKADGTFEKTSVDFDGGDRVVFGDVTGNGLLDAFRCGWVYADLTRNTSAESIEAPAAPAKVDAKIENGQLTVTWEYEEGAAEEAGLAFNIFVKAGDKLFTLLPADPETGFLRVSQDKHTALRATVRSYTMAAPAAEKFTVGVQTISNYTETYSPFVTTEVVSTGISSIKNNDSAAPVYYNMQGMKVSEPKAGQVYVRKQGNKAEKFISK